jgi:hypothetical protein
MFRAGVVTEHSEKFEKVLVAFKDNTFKFFLQIRTNEKSIAIGTDL